MSANQCTQSKKVEKIFLRPRKSSPCDGLISLCHAEHGECSATGCMVYISYGSGHTVYHRTPETSGYRTLNSKAPSPKPEVLSSWKLVVLYAVIPCKLLYGLATIHITKAVAQKLDAFQYRGLPRNLGMPPRFIQRADTNRRLLEVVTTTALPKITFSIYCTSRKSFEVQQYRPSASSVVWHTISA